MRSVGLIKKKRCKVRPLFYKKSNQNPDHTDGNYTERLYTPTFITKETLNQNEIIYFIVDCWHHRIIFSKDLYAPISNWNILTDAIAGPHSLACDGDLLITEDTGRNALMVFKYIGNGLFNFNQYIQNIGIRPHRTIYDEASKLFYIIGGFSQNIVAIKNDGGTARIIYNKQLEVLKDCYVRSIRIIGNKMYFVAANTEIIICNYLDASYKIENKINLQPICSGLSGANDIWKHEDYYYLTASPKKFIRFRSTDIQTGKYEDLYDITDMKGTPYYLQVFDGRVFLPEITEYSRIRSFLIKNNSISDLKTLFDFGPPQPEDIKRYCIMPK